MNKIVFTPCSGFGSQGRTACIQFQDGREFSGHGETDEEAVLEALINSGLSFSRAFDQFDTVLREAAVSRWY